MIQYRKYGTQCTILFPLIKASSQNFAVSGDYTHSSGDIKISKDGGTAATATNSPSAITMGNGAIWSLTLSATEMQAAEIVITIIDAATKAIEDQCIVIHTHGNASAMIVPDLSVANLAANVTQFGGSNGTFSSGRPETNVSHIAGSSVNTSSAQIGVNIVNAGGTAWNSGAITSTTFNSTTGLSPVRTGTCQSGSTSTTIKLDSGASSSDDFYKYQTITISGGTGAGQSAIINSYVGSTKVATINKSWATTPDETSTFVILREAELQSSGSVSLGTNAPAGWINAAAFASNAIDSTVLATNAVSEIASGVDSVLTSTHGSGNWTTATGFSTLTSSDVRSAIGLASANLDTQLSTIDDFLDTEIAAIKSKTDNLPASPAATSDIPSAEVIADAVWDEVISTSFHNGANSAGKKLRQVNASVSFVEASINDASATTTSFITDLTSSTDNFYNQTTIVFTSGSLAGQTRIVSDYNGSTKTVTLSEALTSAPANGDSFQIISTHTHTISDISSGVWSETTRTLSNPAGLKKNEAVSNFNFVLVDSSDTPVTGATVTATRSIDGGAFSSCTNSASEIGNGVYKINLSASDLNGDVITLSFTATGAKTRLITIFTEP